MKLMIADDQMSLHTFLDKMMDWASLGITDILHVYNGEEAAAQAITYKPDILLIDIRMPILDGLGALKQLQSMDKRPKSVILSAYDQFEYARDALRLHVFQYLLKPVDTRLLENVINELVQEIHAENHLLITNCLDKAAHRIPLSNTDLIILRDSFQLLGITRYAVWTVSGNVPMPEFLSDKCMSSIDVQNELFSFKSIISSENRIICFGMKKAYNYEDLKELRESLLKKWEEDAPDLILSIGMSRIETNIEELSSAINVSAHAAQTNLNQSGTSKLEHTVRKIKAYVESKVDDDLSLQTVADQFQIDKYQLSRIFKQEIGVNYWAFVTKIRMQKAAHLLMETSWKNNSIAERIGFVDESHFSRTFKKYFGVTPKEYRSSQIVGKDA